MAVTRPLLADERAQLLAPERDDFVRLLAKKFRGARRLTYDERELVIDEAITFVVMEYPEPLHSPDDVTHVFWKACELRIWRTLDGRRNTVRRQWHRVGEAAATEVADPADPVTTVEEAEERKLADEFAATLRPQERRVLRVKFFSGTTEPLGYKKIAQQLRISIAAARSADRAINKQIKVFAALVTAGRLCPTRELEITALATSTADPEQARRALAHVAHCQFCNTLYVQQTREFRSAAFQRKVAAALPATEVQERGRLRGAWDAIADCATRPFGHDTVAAAAQVAASGTGRGVGTIAMLKLAGACLASATAVTVCTTSVIVPALTSPPPKPTPAKVAKAKPEGPVGKHNRIETRAQQHVIPTPTPTPKPKPERNKTRSTSRSNSSDNSSGATQGGTGPTAHEATPASPAPANAAPGGESEFDPTYKPSSPPQPAPAPAAPGGGEFF